jgi:hypothetical protein
MALFQTTPDNQILDFWLSTVRSELHSAAIQKASDYNFDFFKSVPSEVKGRFDWSSHEEVLEKSQKNQLLNFSENFNPHSR